MTPAGAGSSRGAARTPKHHQGIDQDVDVAIDVAARLPREVLDILERLWSAGFEAYVVGGSLRDLFLDRAVADWDVATSARPEQVQELFPQSVYENRFGTVTVRLEHGVYEITTFRREHRYADHRRPGRVEFGASIDEDLARRDFTMNAIAWGGGTPRGAARAANEAPTLHDPFAGVADLRAGRIRAVGNPGDRFEEDALRMLRAVRFAATLGFVIEPRTLDAIGRHTALAADLSGERVQAELRRLLSAPRPSVGLALLAETGLLDVLFPDLAAQRGMAQNKVPGADLWQHTMASVDAVDPARPIVRLAALFHDAGKPATLADGHFPGHETEGAVMAERILRELAFPRHEIDRVRLLVAQHMFNYGPDWSDAAVRRFMRRVGVAAVDDLLVLREADNAGSGLPRDAGRLAELRQRVLAERSAHHALDLADLAVDGDDLQAALGMPPGPEIGRILDTLLERVVADPGLNDRVRLLDAARDIHDGGAAAAQLGAIG